MKKKYSSLYISISVILLLFSILICSCATENTEQPSHFDNLYPASFKVLTQNAMLIPLGAVAPSYRQRSLLISEIISNSDFYIVGLQEIFWDTSQDLIIDRWYKSLNTQDKKNRFPGYRDKRANIKEAMDVAQLSIKENAWNIEIMDAKPSGNTKTARIAFGPYHVLGPDTGRLNLLKQDSGLLILSRYPVIAASAFSFSNLSGSDRLANKGVLYARIKVGKSKDDYIHFFNTHLQSHQYPDTRLENLKELFSFISNIIHPELDDKGQVNPIIITGDFNESADMPSGWIKKAGIISSGKDSAMPDDFDINANESEEFSKFIKLFNDFSQETGMDLVIIKDIWAEIFPEDPGFTWIGKEWELSDSNPYGKEGNMVAIEEGPPQRIDYIFYFAGSGNIKIAPEQIALFPEKPLNSQISDHLGIQAVFAIN